MTSWTFPGSTDRRSAMVCVAVVAVVCLIAGGVEGRPRSQSCSLSVRPEQRHVPPGVNISFVCNARCLGALSHGQLVWKDPHGVSVPGLDGDRIRSVAFNRYTVSVLMISMAQTADQGVYTCEVRHQNRLLQYSAVLQVRAPSRTDDPGPKRGDIYIEPEPDFSGVRPVRSVSRPFGPGSRREGEGSPGSRNVGIRNGLWNDSPHPGPALPPSPLESVAGMQRLLASEEEDVAEDFEVQSDDGDEGADGRRRVRRQADNVTQPPPQDPATDHGHFQDFNSSVASATNGTEVTMGPYHKEMNMSTVSPMQPDLENSSLSTMHPGKVTYMSKQQSTQPMPKTSAPEKTTTTTITTTTTRTTMAPSTRKPIALTTKAVPAAKTTQSSSGSMTTKPSGSGSGSGSGGKGSGMGRGRPSGRSGQSTEVQGETDFGRYGMLAFGLTLGAALLLLYALLLVLLVPKCRKRRKKKHTLNLTPDNAPPHDGRYSTRQGPDSNTIPLGDRPHKPLAPMTSATGLNGEYITSVDLDAKATDKAGDDDRKEGGADGAADGAKTEDEGKEPQESFVSTFLIGRLSSSKPTDENTPDDVTTTPQDDNVFGAAKDGPDGAGEAAGSGGDDKRKESEGADSKPEDDSDSESSASSSADEGEHKLDSSSHSSKDAAPPPADVAPSTSGTADQGSAKGDDASSPAVNTGNDAGLMSEIHLEVSPTGIVGNTPTDV